MVADMKPQTTEIERNEERKSNVWRTAPRIWERCITCDVHKKCTEAGIKRGTKSCSDARASMIKRGGEKGPFH